MRVLAVASEVFPLIKTGGLADVAAALPVALKAEGIDVTTILPGYPSVIEAVAGASTVHRFPDLFGGPANVLQVNVGNLDLFILDAPHLYERPGNPYLAPDGKEWPDNPFRFAGLAAAAAAIGAGETPGLSFHVVHAHDWQAALAPVYLHFHPGPRPKTVMTIHNLAFQGIYNADVFPRLGLPWEAFSIEGMEFHGNINFLKGGLCFADRLTTVSPTYAREITGMENGMGLDGLLRRRGTDLIGILNGIDDHVWDPANDPLIAAKFSRSSIGARAANKAALQRRLGLAGAPDTLLLGIISRMTTQKGLDLLASLIDEIVASGMQLAVLGAGAPAIEQAFTGAAARHPGAVGCVIGYDESLAHLIQAGSDALLVPSRFEPCGLTQLCALRYGSIPVVSRVGGLADTVVDANEAALASGVATGIQFWPTTEGELRHALFRLKQLWNDPEAWRRTQANGMAADVSWQRPADHYAALYRALAA